VDVIDQLSDNNQNKEHINISLVGHVHRVNTLFSRRSPISEGVYERDKTLIKGHPNPFKAKKMFAPIFFKMTAMLDPPELSEYECLRKSNIIRNNSILDSLEISVPAIVMQSSMAPRKKAKTASPPKFEEIGYICFLS
jgi:hypothetical protein